MKNKRSLFIVIAMVLLLAVVLGMGGTTFAKYTTTKSAPTETATVAQWGFVVTASAADLFGEKYDNTGAISDTGAAVVSVNATADPADADVNVVAPGTKGEMTFSVNGTSEVLSKLTVDATTSKVIALTKDIDGTAVDYEPLKWTVTGNATIGTTDLLDGKTLTNLSIDDLCTLLDELSTASIAANTAVDIDLTVSWAWAFEVDADTNVYETALGALIAGTTEAGSAAGTTAVDFGLTVTIEQIQA